MIENLTATRLANSVMQQVTAFNGAFLLVEGKTDLCFYSKFCDNNYAKIEVGFGRENVVGAVQILNERGFGRHLGIKDADYSYLIACTNIDNLIITDDTDIEIMIARSPAFESLMLLVGSSEKIKKFENEKNVSAKEWTFELLRAVGCLRLLNERSKLGLKFKPKTINGNGLKYKRIICSRKFEFLGIKEMVEAVIEYSRGGDNKLPKLEVVVKQVEELVQEEIKISHLINGHDLCHAISISLERVLGSSNKYDAEFIEQSLILAYDSRFFVTTQLYSKIKLWEESHTPYRILNIEN